MRSALVAMILCGLLAAAQAQTPAPTIEEVEAQIQAEEARRAAAAQAAGEAQAKRNAEAARKAEAERQARVNREAAVAREREVAEAAAAAAKAAQQATLIIKTDTRCQLSINGEDRGLLEAAATQRMTVAPGEQLIECSGDGRRVEQTASVDSGKQAVVQLVLPPKGRFERIAEGVRDNEQGLIWAERDNGSDINWTHAGQYCAARGAGWSLPTSAALQSLYDASGKYPQTWNFQGTAYTLKPATPLIGITSCCFWSNEQNGASEAWGVALGNGFRFAGTVGRANTGRALCVRRS